MITIIKYKSGNISSIVNMLNYLGYFNVKHSNDHMDIYNSDALILPGVGNFDFAVKNLHNDNIFKIIQDVVKTKKTFFLGICLGMQLIFNKSDEGKLNGLNLINGNIKSFNLLDKKNFTDLKVPHMGWNNVKIKSKIPLLNKIEDNNRFYFAHSYYVDTTNSNIIVGETNHGVNFSSIINLNNVFGVQFHPEKSLNDGKKILKNFIEMSYARKKNYSHIIT